jgi:hypothetical protein
VTEPALFDLDDDADQWRPIFNVLQTCRDCGRSKFGWEKGCGGAGRPDGLYVLCDDCAALDGVGQRNDGLDNSSRWGIATTPEERERLTELQRKRQGAWLRANRLKEQVSA